MTGLALSNPAIAAPTGPLTMLPDDPPAPGKHPARAEDAKKRPRPRKTESANRSTGKPETPRTLKAAPILMVPASGDTRARLVRSAMRLVGIRNSFDGRSFVGHLLAICDLLPTKAKSTEWNSRDEMSRARSGGTYRVGREGIRAGDLVYFACGKGCGADAADGVGVGVCVDDAAGVESFVAYIDGVVGRFGPDRFIQLTGSSAP